MHIPDGFLDTKTVIVTTALSAGGVTMAWRKTKATVSSARLPLLGVTAAFVFAAQMLNFPVAAGTSGHLMGAVLAAVLLGPGAAVLALTTVLLVQCFLFADGGLLALGANVFNMAVVGPTIGYTVYRMVSRMIPGEGGRITAWAFASWCSVVLASMCCAGELAWSGTVAARAVFPAMTGVHAMIGLGEGVITSLVIMAIRKVRPELMASATTVTASYRDFIGYGIVVALGLILFVSPFVSAWPDGLETVAARLGFDRKAIQDSAVPSIMGGYRLPGIGASPLGTVLAGTVGVIMAFAFSFLISKVLIKKASYRVHSTDSERR